MQPKPATPSQNARSSPKDLSASSPAATTPNSFEIPKAFNPMSVWHPSKAPSPAPFNWAAHTQGIIGGRLYIAGDVARGMSFDASTMPLASEEHPRSRNFARRHTVALENLKATPHKTSVETYGTPARSRATALLFVPPGMSGINTPMSPSPSPNAMHRPIPSPAGQPMLMRRMSEGCGILIEGMMVPDVSKEAKGIQEDIVAAHLPHDVHDTSTPQPEEPAAAESKVLTDADAFAASPISEFAVAAEGGLAPAAEDADAEAEAATRDSGVDFDKQYAELAQKSVLLGWSNWESYVQRHFL